MNEQQLADLFSEQVDHMLQGEAASLPPEAGDLQELLDIVGPATSQTKFQAGSAAQAAFQSQLAGWFGLANGGSPMTILGLSNTWFLTIVTAVTVVVVGCLIAVVAFFSIFVFGVGAVVLPTGSPTATGGAMGTPMVTATTTITPPTPVALTATPLPPSAITLIFQSQLNLVTLCQGTFATQSVLVNSGPGPVTNAALAWEIIEGAQLVDNVQIDSPSLTQAANVGAPAASGASAVPASLPPGHPNSAAFQTIAANQQVKLNIKVKVKDKWWNQQNQTQIKVKLSLKNKGNQNGQPNPGHSQVVTIANQDAQWVTLTGVAQTLGPQSLLVAGTPVTINNCTGLPPTILPGSNVQVIGIIQPDNTFIAINITIINVTIVTGDFDSGVPNGDGSDDGGSKGGQGGSKGGKGSKGSKGSKGK